MLCRTDNLNAPPRLGAGTRSHGENEAAWLQRCCSVAAVVRLVISSTGFGCCPLSNNFSDTEFVEQDTLAARLGYTSIVGNCWRNRQGEG